LLVQMIHTRAVGADTLVQGGRPMAQDNLCEFHINNEGRIIRLEERVGAVEQKIATNHADIGGRIDDMLAFFRDRDETYTKNMWKAIFGLLGLMALVLMTLIGIKEIPKFF
jgi:hypothetical protein